MSLLSKIRPQATSSTKNTELSGVLERWQAIAAADPDNVDARLHVVKALTALGLKDELESSVTALVQVHGDKRPVMFAAARHALRSGQDELALQRWKAIDERWPDLAEPVMNTAHLLLRVGQHDEALQQADRLALHDRGKSLRVRAKALRSLNRPQEALAALSEAIDVDSLDADSGLQQVRLLQECGDEHGAAEALKVAAEAFPDDVPLCLARVDQLVKERRFAPAMKLLDGLPDPAQVQVQVVVKRAHVLMNLERFDEADQLCSKHLAANPDNIRLLTAYARIGQARIDSRQSA